jgi:hypothetical protein
VDAAVALTLKQGNLEVAAVVHFRIKLPLRQVGQVLQIKVFQAEMLLLTLEVVVVAVPALQEPILIKQLMGEMVAMVLQLQLQVLPYNLWWRRWFV